MKLSALAVLMRAALSILSHEEKKGLLISVFFIFAASASEVLGIASVIPFLSLASTPSILNETAYLRFIYDKGHFSGLHSFMIVLGVGAVVMLLISTIVNILAISLSSRWIYMREYSIASRLFQSYLAKPYHFFINRHSTEFSKNIFTEIALVINGIFIPGAYLIIKVISVVIIVIALMIFNIRATVTILLVFGIAYLFIFLIFNRACTLVGKKRGEANESRFKVVAETFGSIKEAILYHKQEFFLNAFNIPSEVFVKAQCTERVVGLIPRYVLELLAFGGALMFVLIQLREGKSASFFVPSMIVYVLAGYRLLPDLQQIYAHATKINFNSASLFNLSRELRDAQGVRQVSMTDLKPVVFQRNVAMVDIEYGFEGARDKVLRKLKLDISAGEKIGLIGETGCGKSTTVNLLSCLLRPSSGAILVDGQELTDELVPQWQEKIGFVTQHIYLGGIAVKENIAFGIQKKDIDFESVKFASRISQLHDFIENELPRGYDTEVGERGVRLSGGQIQRIGIARALYRRPDLLIMDEATNALDSLTEEKIYSEIFKHFPKLTVVIITHRISTLSKCDFIYLLKSGQVVAHGSYSNLFSDNDYFRDFISRLKHQGKNL